jgi:hypothetical protein
MRHVFDAPSNSEIVIHMLVPWASGGIMTLCSPSMELSKYHLREFGVLEQETQVSMHDIAANDIGREYQGQTGSVQR